MHVIRRQIYRRIGRLYLDTYKNMTLTCNDLTLPPLSVQPTESTGLVAELRTRGAHTRGNLLGKEAAGDTEKDA